MQEIAQVEPEEQQLKARQSKEMTSIVDDSLELQETEFNDTDQLSEEEPYNYRFSRREGMKVKWGHLRPLFFRKDGSGPRIVLGPDCTSLVTRGIHRLFIHIHKCAVLRIHVHLRQSEHSDGPVRTHSRLPRAAGDHGLYLSN